MTYLGFGHRAGDVPAERRASSSCQSSPGSSRPRYRSTGRSRLAPTSEGAPLISEPSSKTASLSGSCSLSSAPPVHARDRIGTVAATLLAFPCCRGSRHLWFCAAGVGRSGPRLHRLHAPLPRQAAARPVFTTASIPVYSVCAQDGDHVDRTGSNRLFCLEIDWDAPAGPSSSCGLQDAGGRLSRAHAYFGNSI